MTHPISKIAALIALTAVATLSGCDGRQGSGFWDEDTREVTQFNRLDITGAVAVFVEVDPNAPPSVVVSGDDNLVGSITTRVKNGTLEISSDDWIDATLPLEVWVKTRNLRGVSGSGAVEVTAWNIASKRLDVDTSGAALIRLAGKVNDLRVDTSGAADVRTKALHADDVRIDTSGASDVNVCVWESLSVEASGASDVSYYGEPKSVNTDISGAGDVTHKSKTCADFTPPVRKTFDKGDCSCPGKGGNDFVDDHHGSHGAGSGNDGGGSAGSNNGGAGSDGGSAGSNSGGANGGGTDGGSAGSNGSGANGGSTGTDGGSAGSNGSGANGGSTGTDGGNTGSNSGGSGTGTDGGGAGSNSGGSGSGGDNSYQPGGSSSGSHDDDDCDD